MRGKDTTGSIIWLFILWVNIMLNICQIYQFIYVWNFITIDKVT